MFNNEIILCNTSNEFPRTKIFELLFQGISVTPLLIAVGMPGMGAVDVMEALLAAGADPNSAEVDTQPQTPKVYRNYITVPSKNNDNNDTGTVCGSAEQ